MAALPRWLAIGACFLSTCYSALLVPNGNQQKALAEGVPAKTPSGSLRHGPRKTRQNSTICDAGSAQWTGFVPLGKGRNMFYWYFESLVRPEEAPLVIWTNGGPGGSSMLGAFFEIGPCTISPEGDTTSRNPFGWTAHANMLFIDQPIGVGLSSTSEALWANSLLEGGIDVDKFLDTFLDDLFPELVDRPIHFAGESFGGKYVPVYAAMTRRKFASVILVDPYIDPPLHALSAYEHFCPVKRDTGLNREGKPPRYLNETACAAMEAAYGRCDRLRKECTATYDADICWLAQGDCGRVEKWVADETGPGGRNPYDDRLVCREAPLCGDMGQNRTNIYFNLPHVKQALGLPDDFKYDSIDMAFNRVWNRHPDVVVPSTRELTALLDAKHTRILVINGNNDGAVTSESVTQVFDELPWHGHAAFKGLPYRPWQRHNGDGSASGGYVKSYGNLTVVTVNEAGHMSVHDQADASLQLFGSWINEVRPLIHDERLS